MDHTSGTLRKKQEVTDCCGKKIDSWILECGSCGKENSVGHMYFCSIGCMSCGKYINNPAHDASHCKIHGSCFYPKKMYKTHRQCDTRSLR
jgi:hypothetical protein